MREAIGRLDAMLAGKVCLVFLFMKMFCFHSCFVYFLSTLLHQVFFSNVWL